MPTARKLYDHNASYTDVSTAFLVESHHNLIDHFTRIEHCLNQLTDDQLWWRPHPKMNSIANLLLHLSGNVGQWIISAVHNTPPTRNRPAEFVERGPIPKSMLQAQLKTTIDNAVAAIDSLKTADQLLAPRHVQGNDTTVLTAIFHAVSHFEGHTQEIISMTRQLRGDKYEFLWTPKTPQQVSEMNLLAHAALSPPDDAVLVGNLTADWIKGRARRTLPAAVQAGMILHRRIDIFTDTHPLVGSCAALFSEKWSRYSAILVDIFFDHLLAADWSRYSDQPLKQFVSHVYRALHAYRSALPEHANLAICAMTMDDWLCSYATLDGIRLTLTRMSARLQSRGHDIELAPAVDDFYEHRDAFQHAFEQFFPELQYAVRHVAEVAA